MDRTQIALQNRETLTPILEQVARRLSATPINPQNISGATQPELPTINNSTENRARQNIMASSMSTEDFIRRAEQGEQITREDLTALEARQTRGILDFLKRGEEREERGRELLEESGISQLREQQAQFANELAAERRALDVSIRNLQREGGRTKAQAATEARELERISLQKQADLAILANASANNLQVARENIQDRLNIEFGDLDAQLDNYKIQVQAVQGLSDTIKRDLIEQAEQEADAQKEQRALKEQLLDTAARIAQTNPALAREMVNMTMGEVTFESVQNITGQAITSGAFNKPGEAVFAADIPGFSSEDVQLDVGISVNDLIALNPDITAEEIFNITRQEYSNREANDDALRTLINRRLNISPIQEILPGTDLSSIEDYRAEFTAEDFGRILGEGAKGAVKPFDWTGRQVMKGIQAIPGVTKGLYKSFFD